jgi:hypothetical protein
MAADAPEPIRGIPRIRLLPVQDRVPVAALECGIILRYAMRLFEATEVQPQPGKDSVRRKRVRRQVAGMQPTQPFASLSRRALADGERHLTSPVTIERQNARYRIPVLARVELQAAIVPASPPGNPHLRDP